MVKKINYGKILIVLFLTVLIWISADLAQDDKYTIPGFDIILSESTSRDLMVSLEDKSRISIRNIKIRGPASRITVLKREFDDGTLKRDLMFSVEDYESMPEADQYTIDVVTILKKSERIKKLGLTVESCEPARVNVKVEKLTEKALTVECVNEDGITVTEAICQPDKVQMYVPQDWEGAKLKAYVQLDALEEERARSVTVEKTPFIKLPTGQKRESVVSIKVRTPSVENLLKEFTVTDAVLGITFSRNMQNKYGVEVLNNIGDAFAIMATQEAYDAYKKMVYQIILEIKDDDEQLPAMTGEREIIYNFPQEYLRKNAIKLKNPPGKASFRLVKLESVPPVLE